MIQKEPLLRTCHLLRSPVHRIAEVKICHLLCSPVHRTAEVRSYLLLCSPMHRTAEVGSYHPLRSPVHRTAKSHLAILCVLQCTGWLKTQADHDSQGKISPVLIADFAKH